MPPSRSRWLVFHVLLALACACADEGTPAASQVAVPARARPNVLLILVDDLRPALGCYGDLRAVTPNIDRLASASIVFERAYCQQALCHPSRASFLSGARPDATGVFDLRGLFRERLHDAPTLPELFLRQDWKALALGKVHHGSGSLDDERSWSEAPWRPEVGDVYFTERGLAVLRERTAEAQRSGHQEVPRGLAAEAPDVADEVLHDGQVAAEARRQIDALAGEPFFLAVGFKKPHLPFIAPRRDWEPHPPDEAELAANPAEAAGMPEFAGTSSGELRAFANLPASGPIDGADARELIRGYYACTTFVDRLVGDLLAHLEEAGLADRTIVVLAGDHGFQLGENGMWCKHTNTEVATRVPLIVHVPAALAPGLVRGEHSAALVELVDLYPTLAELAGLELPIHLEGTSLVPLLSDPSRAWKRAAFSQYPSLDAKSGREVMGRSLRTARYRFTQWRAERELVASELYDYEADPLVTQNFADTPEYATVQAELTELMNGGWRGALPPERSQ